MKKHIPAIILVCLVILGVGLLFLEKTQAPTENTQDTSSATSTESISESEDEPKWQGPFPAPVPVSSAQSGPKVVIWKVYENTDWAVRLSYDPDWKFGYATSTKNGKVSQVSFAGGEATVLVSKDMPIAEPSRLEYATHVETIAGQEVSVHEYTNPNEQYAFYEYFALTAGNDTYYFSIKSTSKVKAPTDAFIDRITLK